MDCLKKELTKSFNKTIDVYVEFISVYATYMITSVLFVTCLLGSGLRFWTAQQSYDVEHLYTPSNGKSIAERQSSFDLWPLNPNRFIPGRTYDLKKAGSMIIKLKNDSNIVKHEYLDELNEWNAFLLDKMTIPHPQYSHINLTFSDLCLKYQRKCSFTNKHIFLLQYAVKRNKTGDLTFPRWEILRGSSSFYAGYLIGGVDLEPDNVHIEAIKALFLIYYLRYDGNYSTASERWELEFERQTLSRFTRNHSSAFDVAYWHSRSFVFAVDQWTVVESSPMTILCIAVLFIATCLLSIAFVKNRGRCRIDFVNTKTLLCVCGLLSATLANVVTVGTWGYYGGTFSGSLQVTTFLSVAVGLDDMFIMNRAWVQSSGATSVKRRMALSLKYSIHSITITSLTSCICFFIGASSRYYGIVIFCIVMAFNMAVNYLYVITLYAACMYWSGIVEHRGLQNTVLYFFKNAPKTGKYNETYQLMMNGIGSARFSKSKAIENQFSNIYGNGRNFSKSNHTFNSSIKDPTYSMFFPSTKLNVSQMDLTPIKTDPKANKSFANGISENGAVDTKPSIANNDDPLTTFIQTVYSELLLKRCTRIAVAIVYALYLAISIYGVLQTNVGSDVRTLAARNFHANKFLNFIYDYFYSKGQQLEIIVNNPPDLVHSYNRQKIHQMVSDLENKRHTMSSEATDFFLRDYEQFLNLSGSSFEDTPQIWEASLSSWATLTSVKISVESDIKWTPVPGVMKRCLECKEQLRAFRFRIGLRRFDDRSEQILLLREVRKLNEKYGDYNLTSYHQEWPWFEQYDTMARMAALTIFYTIVCMFVVATLFFRSVYCVFWTTVAVLSIDLGVIGFMNFANVNLDFVSVTVVIMSIGLSVDYTAHIVHGFKVAKGTADAKIRIALGSLGWPVLQGGITTFAGVSVLLKSDFYVVYVFGAVTSLSILFGMCHACVFLPTALCCSQEIIAKMCNVKSLVKK